jgi:hypothetical protein
VQVELVITQAASKNLQIKIARLQLLLNYLLSDTQGNEKKFGQEALWTTLTQFWKEGTGNCDEKEHEHDDEILAYSILLRINSCCSAAEESPSMLAASTTIAHLYRKHVPKDRSLPLSLFEWSLRLI